MMKIKATVKGRETIILGFSHANLDRLRADGLHGAIRIDREEMSLPFDILITAAESERVMLDAFSEGIGPNTKVHIGEKLKS